MIHREWVEGTGSGQPLVIVDTVVGDSRTWRDLYRPLAHTHRVLLVDPTNRGRSPSTGEPLSMADQIEEILGVVAEEGVSAPVWVGNSSSTSLACRLAAEGTAGGLVLLSPLLSLGMERRIEMLRRVFLQALEDPTLANFQRQLAVMTCGTQFLEKHRFAGQAMLAQLRSLYTPEQLRLSYRQTFFPEMDDAEVVRMIRCRILALRGAEEMLQPFSLLRGYFAETDFTLQTLESGHNLLEEASSEVFAAIRSFL
jgi:pimeloyl-ACP methyl ester carboxylesterase